ncbi:MAG: anti-sigma F factor [Lachnospiraceae bacterium]|nr:anti-sigma F factor [Lachnospiraceae bacterium]
MKTEGQEWEIRDGVSRMELLIESDSCNESFARVVVASFMARLDPTLEETDDVKTAVSEAVTNAVIHGYAETRGIVRITAWTQERELHVTVEDEGCGIENVEKAMEPMYSGALGRDRSGMGFCFMEAFMDELIVESEVGRGTRVQMKKIIGREEEQVD